MYAYGTMLDEPYISKPQVLVIASRILRYVEREVFDLALRSLSLLFGY